MFRLPTSISVDETCTGVILCSNNRTKNNFHIQYQKFTDNKLYEFWDKEFNIHATDIEVAVSNMFYGGCGRQSTIELKEKYNKVRKVAFPSMTLIFYSLLFILGRIPTFEEFKNTFLSNQSFFKDISDTEVLCLYKDQNIVIDKYSTETRLWIAYPAFIRDLHFACLLNDSNKCETVRISTFADSSDKIDISYCLIGDNTSYGLDLKNNIREEFVSKEIFKNGRLIIDMGDPLIKNIVKCQFGDYYLFNKNAIDFAITNNKH